MQPSIKNRLLAFFGMLGLVICVCAATIERPRGGTYNVTVNGGGDFIANSGGVGTNTTLRGTTTVTNAADPTLNWQTGADATIWQQWYFGGVQNWQSVVTSNDFFFFSQPGGIPFLSHSRDTGLTQLGSGGVNPGPVTIYGSVANVETDMNVSGTLTANQITAGENLISDITFHLGGEFRSQAYVRTTGGSVNTYLNLIDASAGDVTLTLPAVSTGDNSSPFYRFIRLDNSTNTVSLDVYEGALINGSPSVNLLPMQAFELVEGDTTNYVNSSDALGFAIKVGTTGVTNNYATTFTTNVFLPSPSVPASAGAAGTVGQISWDNGFVYICVGANTWKRAALSTW